jgi:imidazolonepropionase-like amidohydrolase
VGLVEAGMSPMQALQAATGWAAECLGQEADLGTLEPGKIADLVVVAGDPLSDISVLRDIGKIRLVLKGGEIAADRRAS